MKQKENIKRLGDFIERCEGRNSDGLYGVDDVLGVNNEGKIVPSKAKLHDVDLSPYKIVKNNNFVYNPARLDIGSISLYKGTGCIVSTLYVIFKVREDKKEELLTEYLDLYLKRKEFHRYVGYVNWGSAREYFWYDNMAEVTLPVPPIEEQRRIVSEYQTIEARIKNNEALIQKLEETAQAIYHHTFVEGIDEENLPEGWRMITIKEFCKETKSGGTPDRGKSEYWNRSDHRWLKSGEVQNNVVNEVEEWISEDGLKNSSAKLIPSGSIIMAMYGATAAQVAYLNCEATTNQACCNMICNSAEEAAYLYFALKAKQEGIKILANGGAQANLSQELIISQKLLYPENNVQLKPFVVLLDYIINLSQELHHLRSLLSLITSKLA